MRKSFVWTSCLAAALAFVACGDDSSTSSNNVEYEDDKLVSSSSNDDDDDGKKEEKSSSSVSKDEKEKSSSSSKEEESSSSADKSGIRAATLDDFGKNMVLKGMFGTDINLSVGSKNGMFTLWLPGKTQDSAWVSVISDFKDGKLEMNSTNTGVASIPGEGTISSMKKLSEGAKISFIVDKEGTLKYVFEGDTNVVETGKAKIDDNYLSSIDDLAKKQLTCANGDTTIVYSFFEDSYLMQRISGKDTTDWMGGRFDIQRNKLLLKPTLFRLRAGSLYTVDVSTSYAMNFSSGEKLKCEASELKFSSIAKKDLATEWDASKDGDSWVLNLKQDGTFELTANNGVDEIREGQWDLFGDNMILKNEICLNTECQNVVGRLTNFDAKKGFTYEHTASYSADLKEHPAEFPTEWLLPRYE